MLLALAIAGERYALPCSEVEEVVPLVPLRAVPLAPEHVRGLLLYRGELVPVLDLCLLAGRRRAAGFLSSRVIVVRCPGTGRRLGLLAEQVTETLPAEGLRPCPTGLAIPGAAFLGEVLVGPTGTLQRVHVGALLTDDVRRILAEATA